jgi:hypothetical protein
MEMPECKDCKIFNPKEVKEGEKGSGGWFHCPVLNADVSPDNSNMLCFKG